jgi:hypothetical protein
MVSSLTLHATATMQAPEAAMHCVVSRFKFNVKRGCCTGAPVPAPTPALPSALATSVAFKAVMAKN